MANTFRFSFVIAVATALLCTSPLFARAQATSSDDLSATIRAAILADPRAASLPPDQLNAMVDALTVQAQKQGMTSQDIVWRPTSPLDQQTAAAAAAGCGNVPASLCALSRALGISGSSNLFVVILGFLLGVLVLVVATIAEMRHRRQAQEIPPAPAQSGPPAV